MKLEDQVCSLELAKELKELGVKQESLFCWYSDHSIEADVYIAFSDNPLYGLDSDVASAFTVAEFADMIGEEYDSGLFDKAEEVGSDNRYICKTACFLPGEDGYFSVKANTEASARAKMLVYLIENKLFVQEEGR